MDIGRQVSIDEELAWERFSTTGNVSDYLVYKEIKKKNRAINAIGAADENSVRGDHFKTEANG